MSSAIAGIVATTVPLLVLGFISHARWRLPLATVAVAVACAVAGSKGIVMLEDLWVLPLGIGMTDQFILLLLWCLLGSAARAVGPLTVPGPVWLTPMLMGAGMGEVPAAAMLSATAKTPAQGRRHGCAALNAGATTQKAGATVPARWRHDAGVALTLRRWRNFGLSGASLVWGGEAFAVQRDGRANDRQLYLDPAVDAGDTMRQLLASLRAGAAEAGMQPDDQFVGLQLTHSGRFSRPDGPPTPLVAHRHPQLGIKYPHTADAHVLTDGELEAIGDNYVKAAKLAHDAGFDFVDVKSCHGYLLHELLGARLFVVLQLLHRRVVRRAQPRGLLAQRLRRLAALHQL